MMKTALQVSMVCVKKDYWELDMNGFTYQPLGYGKTESHNPVPPIRIEPFHQDPILCPVYHLVRLSLPARNVTG